MAPNAGCHTRKESDKYIPAGARMLDHVWKCCHIGIFTEVLGRDKAGKLRIISVPVEIPACGRLGWGYLGAEGPS